ncbi:MAG: hypothetical protein ACUVRA_04750 [Candidatus Bathyarchaeaceae archaeon]
MEKRTFTYLALALLVWAISGTVVAGYYFTQYNIYQNEYENLASEMESILLINILVSHGNGTKIWHNDTALPVGSTAFKAILAIADTEYVDYGGELGILVTSINGLTNNFTHGWLYWYWDAEKSEWILPEYSCAKYILRRGDTIAFDYVNYVVWPPLPPT